MQVVCFALACSFLGRADSVFAIVFVETPELSADSLVYLTSEKRDWLAGRYINATWDLPELMAKKDEIVKGDKLKVKLVF